MGTEFTKLEHRIPKTNVRQKLANIYHNFKHKKSVSVDDSLSHFHLKKIKSMSKKRNKFWGNNLCFKYQKVTDKSTNIYIIYILCNIYIYYVIYIYILCNKYIYIMLCIM